MKRSLLFLTIITLAAVLFVGCGSDDTSLDPNSSRLLVNSNQALFSMPAGATLVSADFNIYVQSPTGRTINVHRINSGWDEMTATWNNFGGAFDAQVYGSFDATSMVWYSVDVTSMVSDWLDGTNANFGLLLEQVNIEYPRTILLSRHTANIPYLNICYSIGGNTVCEQAMAIADTYINEYLPDVNSGITEALFTGWAADNNLEKQTLIRFDLDVQPPVDEDCAECDGKVTELTMAYLGDTQANIEVYRRNDQSPQNLLYSGLIDAGASFDFVGNDNNGTMGTEISIYVNGVLNVKIHTSCSKPIGAGMIAGDFEIITGRSRNGGLLCQVDSQPSDGDSDYDHDDDDGDHHGDGDYDHDDDGDDHHGDGDYDHDDDGDDNDKKDGCREE